MHNRWHDTSAHPLRSLRSDRPHRLHQHFHCAFDLPHPSLSCPPAGHHDPCCATCGSLIGGSRYMAFDKAYCSEDCRGTAVSAVLCNAARVERRAPPQAPQSSPAVHHQPPPPPPTPALQPVSSPMQLPSRVDKVVDDTASTKGGSASTESDRGSTGGSGSFWRLRTGGKSPPRVGDHPYRRGRRIGFTACPLLQCGMSSMNRMSSENRTASDM